MDNHTEIAKFIIKFVIIKLQSLKRCFLYTALEIMQVIAKHGSMYLQNMGI